MVQKKGHKRTNQGGDSPSIMRPRSAVVAIAIALLVSFLAVPFAPTLISQISSMASPAGENLNTRLYEVAFRAIASNRKILPVRRVFRVLAEGKHTSAELSAFRKAEPANSLADYLELLDLLRRDQAGQEPSQANDLTGLIHRLAWEPTPELYISVQRETVRRVLHDGGLSVRQSAAETESLRYYYLPLREFHGQVLRELADLLTVKGTHWRDVGRPKDALAAHEAVVRLLIGLVDVSPTVDIAFLAAERLSSALNELAEDIRAADLAESKIPGEQGEMVNISEACEHAAHKVAELSTDYRQAARAAGNNLLPYTGDSALAVDAHERVMRSLCAACLSASTGLILVLLIVILPLIIIVARPPVGVYCLWRWGRWGPWISSLIVCTPLLLFVMLVTVTDISFTWLFSFKSLPAVIFLPALILVMVGLATRVCVRPPKGFGSPSPPAWAAYLAVGLLISTVLVGIILLPAKSEAWRPPASIQLFRQVGFIVGVESILTTVLGLIWGAVRRRRAGFPSGLQARATLGVCARALLVVSVVNLIFLGINHRNDYQHQRAFARAIAAPLADRLGDDWAQNYFGGSRAVLKYLQSLQ